MRVWGIHPSEDDDPDRWPPVTLPFVAAALAIGVAASAWTGALARAPVVWALFAIAIAVRARMRRSGGAWVLVAAALGASLASCERAAPLRVPAGAAADRAGDDMTIDHGVTIDHRVDGTVTIDDRVDDTIAGVVVGPVVRLADGDAIVIDAGARVLAVVARDAVLPGDRVRISGRIRRPRGFRNPGGVDRAQIVRDRGAELEMTVDAFEVVERDATWSAWRIPTRLHRAASDAIAARGGDAAGNAIVRAAVTGDRSAVDDATDDAWRAAGIYHALSVSGMHLAVVAMLLFGLLRRAWACFPSLVGRVDPGRAAALLAAPVAVAYTLLTGGQTATVRALVVVLAILGGVALRRRLRVLDAVALAAIAILASRPSSLGDPSFQLSFVAALTLCATARRRPGVVGWLSAALRVSLWITATTAPITAWHFHQIALGGVIGNVALAPLVELVVIPAGLAGLALGIGALIDLAVAVAGVVARGAAALATLTPVLDVPPPRAIEILAWYGLLAAAWAWPRLPWRSRARWKAACAGCAFAAVLVGAVAWSLAAPSLRRDLRVTFLDVGQGDAAVVELPGGAVWLIDAGGLVHSERPGDPIRRFLSTRRIRRLDVVVISHPHPDHYLGLLALADAVEIGELWSARPPPRDPTSATPTSTSTARVAVPTFAAVVARLDARVVHPPLGTARTERDVTLEVLGPIYDDGTGALAFAAADPVRSVNDDSLVVAVSRAGRRILFLGDVEHEGEDALVATGRAAADVVKVAHHGSPTSSTAPLVAATGARWAVVSCGRANRFGFPAPSVVDRWRAAGAEVLRTDEHGAITVVIGPDGSLDVTMFDP